MSLNREYEIDIWSVGNMEDGYSYKLTSAT